MYFITSSFIKLALNLLPARLYCQGWQVEENEGIVKTCTTITKWLEPLCLMTIINTIHKNLHHVLLVFFSQHTKGSSRSSRLTIDICNIKLSGHKEVI